MIGPFLAFIKNTHISQRKRHLIKKNACSKKVRQDNLRPIQIFQNFLASHIRETRIFTNAALFLPLAAEIRVTPSPNDYFLQTLSLNLLQMSLTSGLHKYLAVLWYF